MAVNSLSRMRMDLLGSWRGPSRATRLAEVRRRCLHGEVEKAGLVSWEGAEVYSDLEGRYREDGAKVFPVGQDNIT